MIPPHDDGAHLVAAVHASPRARHDDPDIHPPGRYDPGREGGAPAVADPEHVDKTRKRPRWLPLWYVILHDDNLHTYEYVVEMLCSVFGMSAQRAFLHAVEVDTQKVTIVARLPKDKAILKRDQIMSYGGDPRLGSSVSMNASIEPCDD